MSLKLSRNDGVTLCDLGQQSTATTTSNPARWTNAATTLNVEKKRAHEGGTVSTTRHRATSRPGRRGVGDPLLDRSCRVFISIPPY